MNMREVSAHRSLASALRWRVWVQGSSGQHPSNSGKPAVQAWAPAMFWAQQPVVSHYI